MGAVATGMGTGAKRSAGFGTPMNPDPILTPQASTQVPDPAVVLQQSALPLATPIPEQPITGALASVQPINVVKAAPASPQVNTSKIVFPTLPPVEKVGAPEMASAIKDNLVYYSPVWYGTEDQRQDIRKMLLEWGESENLNALLFFTCDEWYYRPPARLKKMETAD